jgi:hypothetical protein
MTLWPVQAYAAAQRVVRDVPGVGAAGGQRQRFARFGNIPCVGRGSAGQCQVRRGWNREHRPQSGGGASRTERCGEWLSDLGSAGQFQQDARGAHGRDDPPVLLPGT